MYCSYFFSLQYLIWRRNMVDNSNNITGAASSKINGSEGVIKSLDQEQRLLPIANVGRIMKQILPPNAKISKEAKETMQECVSEFVSFVTGEASDKCRKERRKTVNGDDVCWALAALGFDDYAGPMKRYLHRYREQEIDRAIQEKARSSAQANHNLRLNEANRHLRGSIDEVNDGTEVM
ncbi:Nuclear transcription factor Y subunit B [Parasponia andersonii]|uniref:Nuclear transcription factor Y subunit B n=1 Tax=Parasponia andersonii TaxID=3476 RepID=A0A2P5E465_PARAD|nr:Nuclear transcription factor Y subunit B [Parasponia andersonii]